MKTDVAGAFPGRTNTERCPTEVGLCVNSWFCFVLGIRISVPRNKGPEAGG